MVKVKNKYPKKIPRECNTCHNVRPISFEGQCGTCRKSYLRKNDPKWYIRGIYSNIRTRCTNKNRISACIYYGKVYCSLDEFFIFSDKDCDFLDLFNNWRDNDYKASLAPSIDRMDNDGDYNIENLQWITRGENSCKDRRMVIDCFSAATGDLIKTFKSQSEASRELKIAVSCICENINGKCKETSGYIFKKKELGEVKK